mgnify:CR=1 FL=1
MKAITFADSKFMRMAQEQSVNFRKFGIDHEIIAIPEQTYGIELWINLLEQTIDQIGKHGKIFRVDSEIRLLKPIPSIWRTSDNVLFFIEPIITNPWYHAINTGHMILSHSSISFLRTLRDMTFALIPPGHSMNRFNFDDEDLAAPAIKISGIEYVKEIIDYDRNDDSHAACTRGDWFTDHTIFTHPFMHNWNTGAHNIEDRQYLRNHFCPNEKTRVIDAVLLGLEKRNTNKNYWAKLGFDSNLSREGWSIDPVAGSFWHEDYDKPKFIKPW